jgi:hypothetical protein
LAEFRETHTVFGPFPDADPLDTAVLFLRTNGYRVVEEKHGEPPAELQIQPAEDEEPQEGDQSDDEADAESVPAEEGDSESESVAAEEDDARPPEEILLALTVERGTPGRGWFSSNLTELQTRVTLRLQGNSVRVTYAVDTTGQHLWDDEKSFWKTEAKALERFVVGEGNLANIAEGEKERASKLRRDFVMMGFWIGAIVAIVLFLALVTLFRAS